MANTNTITFKIGEETRPVLETENLQESIFSELYQKAFAEINNYIGKVSNIDKDEKGGYNYEGVNNIFAFIGERGAGKTSCMMSVAKAIENKSNNLSIMEGLENIKKTTFLNSVLIDPSFFDKKNNILSLIIAHLFQSFRAQASKSDCKNEEEKRRTLIACFEKVQKNLNNLFPKDNSLSTDTLEGLVNFSAAIDLQKNIKALIDAYLSFMNDGKAEFLVLMIDDIDLHTQHAREMAEQIRKYFIQPNVVVLMAVKIDQLSHVIKNGLSKEYKPLIDKNQMSFDLINEMVERYLGKLLPHNHRIYLPDASVYFHSKLKITFNQKNAKDIEYLSVREGVLSLIFEKTRYLFYNTIDTTSYIIPRNLRELRQIIALLAEMDAYRDSEKESDPEKNRSRLKAREYNQTLFLKYFKETWCVNNLTEKAASHIHELFSIADPLLINKTTLKFLQTYFEDFIGDELNKKINNDELYRILKPHNKTYNISLGDVMYIVDQLNNIITIGNDLKFLFAINTLYSIKLYGYYNLLQQDEGLSDEIEVLSKNKILSNVSYFEKLIAGSLINTDEINILDQKQNEAVIFKINANKNNKDSDKKYEKIIKDSIINIIKNTNNNIVINEEIFEEQDHKLNKIVLKNALIELSKSDYRDKIKQLFKDQSTIQPEFVKEVIKELSKSVENTDTKTLESRTKRKISIKNINSVELIAKELLMTFISGRPTIDTGRLSNNYREKEEIRFYHSLSDVSQKNAFFDVTAPFFNLIDLKRCYSRFSEGQKFYYESLCSNNSLIAKLIDFLKKDGNALCIKEVDSYIEKRNKINQDLQDKGLTLLDQIDLFIKQKEDEMDKGFSLALKDLESIFRKVYKCVVSKITIRNIEVLKEFQYVLNDKRELLRLKSTETDILATFYKVVNDIKFKSYNKEIMKFDIFSIYEEILREEKVKELFNEKILL